MPTLEAPAGGPAGALVGSRLGVWRAGGHDGAVDALLAPAVAALTAAGAVVVDLGEVDLDAQVRDDEWEAMPSEFRRDVEAYLTTVPGEHPRSLADLVAGNLADEIELAHFGQELFLESLQAPDADAAPVVAARERARTTARTVLSDLVREHRLDALIAPTSGPAWVVDLAVGDVFPEIGTSSLAAVAGAPHVTVPMGFTAPTDAGTGEQPRPALPVGLSFIGEPWSDARVLALAWAFEQVTRSRRPPAYRP
jgi:amidase